MAVNTARLGLRKPAGSDIISVLTDLDNNYDIIDNAALIGIVNIFTANQAFGAGARTDQQIAIRHNGFANIFLAQNGADASNSNVAIWAGDAGLLGTGFAGFGIVINGSGGGPGGGSLHTRLGFRTDKTQFLSSNGGVVASFTNIALVIPTQVAANIPTDATGQSFFFDNATGAPRWRDSSGNLHSITFTTP